MKKYSMQPIEPRTGHRAKIKETEFRTKYSRVDIKDYNSIRGKWDELYLKGKVEKGRRIRYK